MLKNASNSIKRGPATIKMSINKRGLIKCIREAYRWLEIAHLLHWIFEIVKPYTGLHLVI